jgi:hypothetical protein
MPACLQPTRRVAPVAAGDQIVLAEVGRDRHESERRVDGCLVAGEVCSRGVLMASPEQGSSFCWCA